MPSGTGTDMSSSTSDVCLNNLSWFSNFFLIVFFEFSASSTAFTVFSEEFFFSSLFTASETAKKNIN